MKGIMLFGIFQKVVAEPWSTDASKLNYTLGINIGSYTDRFDTVHFNVVPVTISPDQYNKFLSQPELVGQHVWFPIIVTSRKGGSTGAWTSYRIAKDTVVTLVTKK